ncbi:MAG: hypothetical protein U9Q74_00570 [Gemmatimonadota bacterium]|nr:hypothetical protein [Gemmatimonadota bacterium]
MTRAIPVLFLVGAAACASSSTVGGSTRPVSQDISIGAGGSGDRLTIAPSSGPNVNTLDFAPDRVWKVLPAAFDSVAVPIAHLDPATKTIGNEGFKIRQRLGKVSLSRYFDCGTTQIGPNADSYDVFLTVMVQVQAAGTGSKLVTNVEASARPITFSQAYSRCSSRGSLEARLLDAIKAQLK